MKDTLERCVEHALLDAKSGEGWAREASRKSSRTDYWQQLEYAAELFAVVGRILLEVSNRLADEQEDLDIVNDRDPSDGPDYPRDEYDPTKEG